MGLWIGSDLCYAVNVSWQIDEKIEGIMDLAIAEVCQRTGLSARTVRYYEELGLLPGVRRSSGGRRVYGDDELERLRFIRRLKTLGLTLHEIKDLNALYALEGSTGALLERLGNLLGTHLEELDGRIAELRGLREEMSRYFEHVGHRIAVLAARPLDRAREKASPTPLITPEVER